VGVSCRLCRYFSVEGNDHGSAALYVMFLALMLTGAMLSLCLTKPELIIGSSAEMNLAGISVENSTIKSTNHDNYILSNFNEDQEPIEPMESRGRKNSPSRGSEDDSGNVHGDHDIHEGGFDSYRILGGPEDLDVDVATGPEAEEKGRKVELITTESQPHLLEEPLEGRADVYTSIVVQLKGTWYMFTCPDMLLLLAMFWASGANEPYALGQYMCIYSSHNTCIPFFSL